MRVPVDGGTASDGGLKMPGLDGTEPSPDGKRILLSAFDSVVEIWAIDRLIPRPALAPAPAKK